MTEKAAFTEELIDACRQLGRARIVLRNAVGLSETFAELSALALADGWIHLVQDGAHLPLDVTKLHAVRFHGAPETGESRAISLCGERGCPLVVMVLDQAHGHEAAAQADRFERLLTTYGPLSRLVSARDLPGGRSDTHASRGAEENLAAAVADGATLWH
jgi:hypothetical protein